VPPALPKKAKWGIVFADGFLKEVVLGLMSSETGCYGLNVDL
jgi:hypothetical protein